MSFGGRALPAGGAAGGEMMTVPEIVAHWAGRLLCGGCGQRSRLAGLFWRLWYASGGMSYRRQSAS